MPDLAADGANKGALCLGPNFKWPKIDVPGLPNLAYACLLAMLAGIQYVLPLIPPNINMNFALPDIDLFLKAFFVGIKLPNAYPSFTFAPLHIPGKGIGPFSYNLTGELKLIALCILLPFKLIVNMILDLLNLVISIPTVTIVFDLFKKIALQLGIGFDIVIKFGGCLAKAIVSLFTALI